MAMKYEVVRDRVPTVGGGFVEAFRMALVEFSCLGERRLDIAGYPHTSEHEALMSDWGALGNDITAAAKYLESQDQQGEGGSGGQVNRPKDAIPSGAATG